MVHTRLQCIHGTCVADGTYQTAVYTWHMCSRWYTPDLHKVTTDISAFVLSGNKTCISVQKKFVSSVYSQEVTAMSVSNHLHPTGCGSTGQLCSTFTGCGPTGHRYVLSSLVVALQVTVMYCPHWLWPALQVTVMYCPHWLWPALQVTVMYYPHCPWPHRSQLCTALTGRGPTGHSYVPPSLVVARPTGHSYVPPSLVAALQVTVMYCPHWLWPALPVTLMYHPNCSSDHTHNDLINMLRQEG
jgi:hypothetical protein